jgi:hypothetical protein
VYGEPSHTVQWCREFNGSQEMMRKRVSSGRGVETAFMVPSVWGSSRLPLVAFISCIGMGLFGCAPV